ncbi:TIGR01777 family oxidoreductase [Metabacillus fastidiosus]|uniref:TIGR01777 family oxidoreductase n=1 Tax=Metabacillus fastidiosus TaxID=1458 RepID=UPI002E234255|nr:TIGR01777 family oxidoreductase [Metabacillus fastidiosus]MED4454535.1 TIGR01777 family oxidoreductase [Metabacillus fastidiosus]
MKICISGGTGFIGKQLTDYFLRQGHDIYILTRNNKHSNEKHLHYIKWLENDTNPSEQLENTDVFINLAGKSINSRWTTQAKKEIVESRVKATRSIYSIIERLKTKPVLVINASAVGIYGTSTTETFTENSTVQASDFLADTVNHWEKEAKKIAELNIRTVFCRFGIVLGEEGALPKMVLPYKFFVGGTIGSGKQPVSWIHIHDLIMLIDFIIKTQEIHGPINAVSPYPVTMKEFGKTIAKTMNRPHFIPVPSFILKTLLGSMSMLLLEGQRVLPEKVLNHGFQFTYPTADKALQNLLKS